MERQMQLERFEDEALELVGKTEASLLEAGRTWAKRLGDVMPVEMPVMRAVVRDTFDFTEEVLRLQRTFVHDMLRVTRQTVTTPPGTPRTRTRPSGTAHVTRHAPKAATPHKATA